MSEVKKETSDPENYYKMSEPFESADACNDALAAFYEGIGELRKKHRIRDVLIVTYGSVRYEGGKLGDFMQHSTFGNQMNEVPMAAYVFGQTQASARERINKLISKSK